MVHFSNGFIFTRECYVGEKLGVRCTVLLNGDNVRRQAIFGLTVTKREKWRYIYGYSAFEEGFT